MADAQDFGSIVAGLTEGIEATWLDASGRAGLARELETAIAILSGEWDQAGLGASSNQP